MPDADLYPPDAPNADILNHRYRTGQRSHHWTLRRGGDLLGTFMPASVAGAGVFVPGFTLAPEPAFEEIRPLFVEEVRLLDIEWGINDVGEEHNAVYEQIMSLGLTLVDEHGWEHAEFILHIDADNHAWFRI